MAWNRINALGGFGKITTGPLTSVRSVRLRASFFLSQFNHMAWVLRTVWNFGKSIQKRLIERLWVYTVTPLCLLCFQLSRHCCSFSFRN